MLAAGMSLGGAALACNDGTYPSMLGSVCLMASTYCPVGYVPADGSASPNQILSVVMGKSTLPNLKAQAPAGTLYCINVSGTFPIHP